MYSSLSQNLAVSNYCVDPAQVQEILKEGGAISAICLI